MATTTGLAITRERERGTDGNLLAMPSTPMEVMTGKLILYIGIGLIQSSIILLAARYVFHVPFFGSLGADLPVSAAFHCGQFDGWHYVLSPWHKISCRLYNWQFFIPSPSCFPGSCFRSRVCRDGRR